MEINKPDYSDLYKFVTSIGLLLIFLSILFPWFLFSDPFDIISDSTNPSSQELVDIRQEVFFLVVKNMNVLSCATAIVGFGILGFGLKKWISQQKVRDSHERLEVEKLTLDVRKMTPAEQVTRALEDVINVDFATQPDLVNKFTDFLTESKIESMANFQRLEDRVIKAIARCYGWKNLNTDLKIGSHYADLLLDINPNERAVIEIIFESNPENLIRKLNKILPALGYATKDLDSMKPLKRNFGLALVVVDFKSEEQIREAENWVRYKYRDVNAKLITLEQVDRLESDCLFLTNIIEY